MKESCPTPPFLPEFEIDMIGLINIFDFVEIALEISSVPHEAREELLNPVFLPCSGLLRL